MQYIIKVTVAVKDDGEEIYSRTVTLPEQIGMLEGDVAEAINVFEEKMDEYTEDIKNETTFD